VSYERFTQAWVPEGLKGEYPAKVRVARNLANDRQVITIVELDIPASEFKAVSPTLTRPDALERLRETTLLEAIYEDVFDEASLSQ